MIASLHVSPRRRLGHYFRIHSHNVRTAEVVKYFARSAPPVGPRVDRGDGPLAGTAQRRAAIAKRGRDVAHRGMAAGLRPGVESGRGALDTSKYSRLANYVPDHIDDLYDAVTEAVGDAAFDQTLLRSYFQSAVSFITNRQHSRSFAAQRE